MGVRSGLRERDQLLRRRRARLRTYRRRGGELSRLDEHRWAEDVAREARVGFGVKVEPFRDYSGEEGIVDHLYEPDDADHEERRREVQDVLYRVPFSMSFSAAASPDRVAPSTFGPA